MSTTHNTEMLKWAKYYHGLGWSLMPLHGITEVRRAGEFDTTYSMPICTCPDGEACKRSGKHPIMDWTAYQTERMALAELESHFNGGVNRNLALITGALSNMTVIDLDGASGFDYLYTMGYEWQGHAGPVVSSGKGKHLYFQHDPDTRNITKYDQFPIDVRSEGGYVVLPPSKHLSGTEYSWDRDPTAPRMMLPIDFGREATLPTPGKSPNEVMKFLRGEAQVGERNTAMSKVAGFYAGNGILGDALCQTLINWNDAHRMEQSASDIRSCAAHFTNRESLKRTGGTPHQDALLVANRIGMRLDRIERSVTKPAKFRFTCSDGSVYTVPAESLRSWDAFNRAVQHVGGTPPTKSSTNPKKGESSFLAVCNAFYAGAYIYETAPESLNVLVALSGYLMGQWSKIPVVKDDTPTGQLPVFPSIYRDSTYVWFSAQVVVKSINERAGRGLQWKPSEFQAAMEEAGGVKVTRNYRKRESGSHGQAVEWKFPIDELFAECADTPGWDESTDPVTYWKGDDEREEEEEEPIYCEDEECPRAGIPHPVHPGKSANIKIIVRREQTEPETTTIAAN